MDGETACREMFEAIVNGTNCISEPTRGVAFRRLAEALGDHARMLLDIIDSAERAQEREAAS